MLVALLAGCHAGVDERRIHGEWVAEGESLRFTHAGEVLCELPNLRHCFQYHRPGAPVTFVPR